MKFPIDFLAVSQSWARNIYKFISKKSMKLDLVGDANLYLGVSSVGMFKKANGNQFISDGSS